MRTEMLDVAPTIALPSVDMDLDRNLHLRHAKPSSSLTNSPATSKKRPASDVDAGVTAALTALQLSLKRDLRAWIPPTPVASPVHSRSSKRARFDFDLDLAWDGVDASKEQDTKTDDVEVPRALFSMSAQLQRELARKPLPVGKTPSEHALRARKRRSQLSYFAIAGAFHRAALERERAAQAVE